jgi:Flp pilus assembly protein TadB
MEPSLLGPIDPAHEPHNPVRDDKLLSPTEELDREPDGVPHRVVGFTALFSVMLALLVGFMFLAGGPVTEAAAVVIALLAIPALVTGLGRKARTERDRMHPSR